MAFGIQKKPNLQQYLQEIDLSKIPAKEEVEEVMVKRLTKGAITLEPLVPGDKIEEGDSVILSITGGTPRFNKEKLMVTVGRGLYSKELESKMTSHTVGDEYDDVAEGNAVHLVIREVKRKKVPRPTDAMAEAMGIEGVRTIDAYRKHLSKEMMDNAVYPLVGELIEKMAAECQPEEPTRDVIEALADLEADFLKKHFKEELGKDLDLFSEEDFKENLGYTSLEEFKAARREWYIIKAKQCAVVAAALGIELTGEYDPLGNYEVLGMLQAKLAEIVREDVTRRVK